MSRATKIAVTTLVFGIAAFILNRVLWPDGADAIAPTSAQLPIFIFLSALEAISFGLGISFPFFGWQYLKTIPAEKKKSETLSFIAVTWFLVSWWPHDNMHRVNGMDNLWGLIRIELIFHLTLILSGFILAQNAWKRLKTIAQDKSI